MKHSVGYFRFLSQIASIAGNFKLRNLLQNSSFLVGNNSGPINLGAALSIKSFGLIANDPVEELQYSKIKIITPDNYSNIRCRERVGMKKLTVDKVFNKDKFSKRFVRIKSFPSFVNKLLLDTCRFILRFELIDRKCQTRKAPIPRETDGKKRRTATIITTKTVNSIT